MSEPILLPPFPPGFDPRDAFPILEHWDFFNHGGVSPLPRVSAEAMKAWAEDVCRNAYLTGKAYAYAETVRNRCAKLINAGPDEIAFVKNTSEGIAFVANGLSWSADDEILSTAVEYPANVYPWMDVAARFGARHIMVPERNARIDADELLNAITPRTKLLALSHVEFASGYRNDIARLGAACRERGVLFCVDAIQSLGVIPVDVQAMKIDFLAADSHKWLLGPEGAGFFYCRRELFDRLHPEIGWLNVVNAQDYGNYDFTLRPDAKRFECGTYNIAGLVGMGASLELIEKLGVPFIGARIHALTERLCGGLAVKGYRVYSPRGRDEWSGIVSFTHAKLDHGPIVKELQKKKIAIVVREGRLRACPHFYNSYEQIDRLLEALP